MTNYSEIETVSKIVLDELEANGKQLDVLVENAGVSMRC
jgi:short-subunit dehydrogenase